MFGIIYKLSKLIVFGLIFLFIGYKVVSSIDWDPNGFAVSQYNNIKSFLSNDAQANTFTSPAANGILDVINNVEKYDAEGKAADAEQDKLAKECKENPIMRYVQLIGASDEKKKGCLERSDPISKAQDAVEDINKAQQKQIETIDKQ